MVKIAQVYIQDHGQFQNFQLDLTYPEGHPKAGQAMDHVCLIAPNSVGKSTLVSLLVSYLRNTTRFKTKALFLVKLQLGERFVYGVHVNNTVLFFRDEIDVEPTWMIELLQSQSFTIAFNQKYEQYCIGFEEEPELFDQLWLDNNGHDLICHQPVDYAQDFTIRLTDMPVTKGHEAESYMQTFPLYNEISPEKLTDFWALLIYLIARRADAFSQFLKLPENKLVSKDAAKAVFDKQNPEPLVELARLWAPYLDPLGFELSVATASIPNHVRERLSVSLTRKKDGQRVEYSSLDGGLRRFLFSLGHMWAVAFEREVRSTFLITEEPERGLHPNLQRELVPTLLKTFPAKQSFFTTQSPIVAAAFEPEERVILSLEKGGQVDQRRGSAPKGAGYEALMETDFKG